MTPQGNFMILAPIVLSREAELRGLLGSMNDAPGCVNPNNPLVPFAQFDTLHFARFVILDNKTVGDLRIYGLPVRTFPLYLAFLGDIDGEEQAFLNELVRRASAKKRHCRMRSKAISRARRLRLKVCRHGKFMRS
jgi:hypothetical protein